MKDYPPELYKVLDFAEEGVRVPEDMLAWAITCEQEKLITLHYDDEGEMFFEYFTDKGIAALTLWTANASRNKAPEQVEKVGREEQALAVWFKHQDWSLKQIAAALPPGPNGKRCNAKQLTRRRMPKLAAAIQAYKAMKRPPKGSKSKDGTIEAFDDE